MRVSGIAASPGVGLGPVFRLEREELAVRERRIESDRLEDEVRRFHAALESSRRDLARIRDGIAKELGENEAAIYDAHLMILDDPELVGAVERGIREAGRNAGFVFRGYMSGVAARLDSIEDEYMRERRADVLDVERRVLRYLLGGVPNALQGLTTPSVLIAHELGPSDVAVLARDRVLGIVTEVGGRTSHSAIVARGRGIPAVVSARGVLQQVKNGDQVAVDGYAGVVEINPAPDAWSEYTSRRELIETEGRHLDMLHDEPATTIDGKRIELAANIELPGEVETVIATGGDGVGLFRTEFFYLNRLELPTEAEQYQAYRDVAERLYPRPVIFRTMDLGGDKVASYLGMTHETNPFLGWRGIRFALNHPDVFRAQIRAIYRASAHGNVRIMFPMVSSEEELISAIDMCHSVGRELDAAGVPYNGDLEIGVMVETPGAVWISDVLARHAKFLSIGSNDLTQYTLAMDRDNERLAYLYEPLSPAVLRGIDHTVRNGHAGGNWVGVCGEMAGDPLTAVLLLGLGVDELSTSCFDLPRVKAAIRCVRYEDAREAAREALQQSTAQAVRSLLRERFEASFPDYLLARSTR